MAKKIVKKRKVKLISLLILLLIVVVFFFSIYFSLKTTTKNIIIKGTSYLKDDYIIELAQLKDYPAFWLTSNAKIEKKLIKSPYIKKVKVEKKIL